MLPTQTDENQVITPTSQQAYLIKGDISGIQDFIFNVKSKGAARSLKGRSFFLKILLELGMQMIFDAYDITDSDEIQESKISTSGGNFILQLTIDHTTSLDDIQQKLTNSLQYTGLNIILAYAKMTNSYQETLIVLNQKTRERKYSLLENNFQLFRPFDRNEIIQTHTKGQTSNNRKENDKWQNITNQLKDGSHFRITPSPHSSTLLSIKPQSINIAGYQIAFDNKGIELSNYLESIIPFHKNQLITFQNLTKYGAERGIDKLGVLTMDVDNLGIALEEMQSPESHRTFDKELQAFFNTELASIINGYYKNEVYVVTAGGDDSFFVGKWNTMLDLAIDIRNAFEKKFSSRGLSISGALVIVNANFPVVRFASMAEEALKDAKYKYGQKGNISLFGEVLDWDILSNQVNVLRRDFGKRRDLITSGLLAKARQTAIRIAGDQGIRLSDFWQMGYFMRNTSSTKRDSKQIGAKILAQFRQYLNDSLFESDPVKKRSYRLIFPIAARLAEFDNR